MTLHDFGLIRPGFPGQIRTFVSETRATEAMPQKDRILGKLSGKSWRPREPATGLACSIHSEAQLGLAAELEL
jgi:hypothetical protein